MIRPRAFNFIDTQITQNLTDTGVQVFVPAAAISGVSFSANEHTYFVLQDVNQNREIVRVNARGADFLTITHRGRDGTVARPFPAGSRIYNAPVAGFWADILAAALAAQSFGGSGVVLGLAYTPGSAMDAFPQGTRQLFYQGALPPGWTLDTTAHNHAISIVTANGGTVTGAVDFDVLFNRTTTDGHTLTGAQSGLQGHTHTGSLHSPIGLGMMHASANVDIIIDSTAGLQGHTTRAVTIGTAGPANAPEAHSHNIDMRLRYARMLMGIKANV